MSAKYIVGVECVMMIMLLVGSLDLDRLVIGTRNSIQQHMGTEFILWSD